MTTINPWINFNGNAEEAFNFYQSVFGGEFTNIKRFKDGDDANKLMQINLALPNGHMLIGNDVPSFMGKVSENENRSKIHVGADSKEEAESIFNQLSAGGQVEVPIDASSETSFAMFRDKYGIEWIVEFDE